MTTWDVCEERLYIHTVEASSFKEAVKMVEESGHSGDFAGVVYYDAGADDQQMYASSEEIDD